MSFPLLPFPVWLAVCVRGLQASTAKAPVAKANFADQFSRKPGLPNSGKLLTNFSSVAETGSLGVAITSSGGVGGVRQCSQSSASLRRASYRSFAPLNGARTYGFGASSIRNKVHFGWSDEKLLGEPLGSFDVDSLTLLEFVMEVETAYNVELNEEEVNWCKNVADLVALVATARNGSN
jgi:Phosphopantetheine attachment site